MQRVSRQYLGRALGPLYQTKAARIQIVLSTYVNSLPRRIKAVEIEVVNIIVGRKSLIMVYDSERGRIRGVASTPSCRHTSAINVVLPAPMGAWNAITERPPAASMKRLAACGRQDTEGMVITMAYNI